MPVIAEISPSIQRVMPRANRYSARNGTCASNHTRQAASAAMMIFCAGVKRPFFSFSITLLYRGDVFGGVKLR